MKLSSKAVILGLTLLASASLAKAQLIYRDVNITGATGVVTRFQIWINATNNTLVVDISNTLSASNSANVGTVVGFAFNTPFVVASQTNDNPGTVAFKAKWTQGTGNGLAANTWSNDDYWTESTPFNVTGTTYDQDYGVSTTDYSRGIQYGEKATLSFTFSQDVTAANIFGFADKATDISVTWAEVATKTNYLSSCFDGTCDIGGTNLTFTSNGDLPPTPEPSTYGLMGAAALLGIVAHRRHKAKKATKTV